MYCIGIHSQNEPVFHNFETEYEAQVFFDSLPAQHGQTSSSKVFEMNGDIFMAMWIGENVEAVS